MDPFEEIKTRLRKYPHVKYDASESSITVLPASDNGFTVEIYGSGVEYMVSFNGWHENFTDPEEAVQCFAFGLSDQCRLKEYRRGDFAYRWTVESKENGDWQADSVTSLVLFPFWKRKEVVYLQNNLISVDE